MKEDDESLEALHAELKHCEKLAEEAVLYRERARGKLSHRLAKHGARFIDEPRKPIKEPPRRTVRHRPSAAAIALHALSATASLGALAVALSDHLRLDLTPSMTLILIIALACILTVAVVVTFAALWAVYLGLRKREEPQFYTLPQGAVSGWDELKNPDPALRRDVPVERVPPQVERFPGDADPQMAAFLQRMENGTLPAEEFPGYKGPPL